MGSLVVGVMRPEAHRDELMRIHCETGPAIVWGNSHRYFWRGVEVPAEWIEAKPTLDPRLALTHENAEMRRVVAEIVGWAKVLQACELTTVCVDEYGELVSTMTLDDDAGRPAFFIKTHCPSSFKEYALRVPPDATSPQHGLGWRYRPDRPATCADVAPDWYAPCQET